MENTTSYPASAPNTVQTGTDMSVGAWVGTLLLSGIPIVNFICLIVWAVSSSSEKRSRKNWAIAQFIVAIVVIVLTVVLYLTVGISFLGALSSNH